MEKIIFHLKCISSIITLHESGSLQLGTEEGSVAGGGRFKEYERCRQLGLHAGVRAGGGLCDQKKVSLPRAASVKHASVPLLHSTTTKFCISVSAHGARKRHV